MKLPTLGFLTVVLVLIGILASGCGSGSPTPLSNTPPPPSPKAIVSLTFDDGNLSFYQNGLPLLQKYGLTSTEFIVTSYLGDSDHMTTADVQNLQSLGMEIASHTVTHPHLTQLTFSQMDSELKDSQAALQTLLGVPVSDFATPYGDYNDTVIADAKLYYRSVRNGHRGFNARGTFDPYNLLVQEVHVDTTRLQVQQWIQQAITTGTWLILVYHQVDSTGTTDTYNRLPSDLDADLSYLKSTGVAVETIGQALSDMSK